MNSDTLLIVRNTIFLVNKMTTALFIIKLSIVLFIDKYTTDEKCGCTIFQIYTLIIVMHYCQKIDIPGIGFYLWLLGKGL